MYQSLQPRGGSWTFRRSRDGSLRGTALCQVHAVNLLCKAASADMELINSVSSDPNTRASLVEDAIAWASQHGLVSACWGESEICS
jgi:hypothetical protein